MRRYHPTYREDDDHENLDRLHPRKRPRRIWRCKRPPVVFLLTWAGLVFLLSINFFTLSRDRLPTGAGLVGWQEFANLGFPSTSSASSATSLDDTPAVGSSSSQQDEASNAAGANGALADGPAYPLDVYAPLLPNPAPLTEVTIQDCSPVRLSTCKPPSTPEEDALLGKWVLVPRPLDSEAAQSLGWSEKGIGGALKKLWGAIDTRYVFYRRSRRLNVPRVVDLRVVETGQDPPNGGTEAGWFRVKTDMRSPYMRLWGGKKGLHLYYKVDSMGGAAGSPSTRDADWERQQAALEPITELDIMYGSHNVPWPGFYVVGEVMPAFRALGYPSTFLNARRTPLPSTQVDAQPMFRPDGTFKILQLADLHFSVEDEPCRDVLWETPKRPCSSVNDTVALIGRWLDAEKPDLVVFTGDQLNGQGSSWDPKSTAPKVFQPVIERKIQWAAILGNHDSQSGPLSRPEIQQLFTRLPYSLARVGPAQLHNGVGAGNYYIKLLSPTPDRTNVFNLYFLDSGDTETRLNWGIHKAYDSILQDQIDWFVTQSNKMKKILRPYKPDGGVDLPAQNWSSEREASDKIQRDGDSNPTWDAGSAQGTLLAKPNAITFVHIPLAEFFDTSASTVKFGSDRKETSGAAGAQGKRGFFDALLRQGLQGQRDVRLVVSGHMHNNADCERIEKDGQQIWTCFGGGSSFAGYGMAGFDRRCRVFELSNFGETAHSWNRLEDGSKQLEGKLWDDLTRT